MTLYKVTLDPKSVLNEVTVYNWRAELKRELLKKRGYKSDWSGKPLSENTGVEMHEGIITRAMIPRSIHWHLLIYSELNCVLLLPAEHRPIPPSREWCIQLMYDYYGREVVRDWFYSLPWKSIPFQLL